MSMEVITAGMLTTVQDMGRQGYASHGFQENGACDKYALQMANLLAGNQGQTRQTAGLEFTMKGAALRFSSREVFALAGADMAPAINGRPVPMYCPLETRPGDVLTLGMAVSGLRCYLAVYGGIDVPLVMSSRSTSLKCGLGGYEGRSLRTGDVLRSKAAQREIRLLCRKLEGKAALWQREAEQMQPKYLPDKTAGSMDAGMEGRYGNERYDAHILRIVLGPQDEAFTAKGLSAFVTGRYRLTADSDRMACRLDGPAIETCHGSDIISDGIVEGSVQVASDGKPIVMMADHQTTGGYAKIGTVISTDIPRLAQVRPGEIILFQVVTVQEAVAAARKSAGDLEFLRKRLKEL